MAELSELSGAEFDPSVAVAVTLLDIAAGGSLTNIFGWEGQVVSHGSEDYAPGRKHSAVSLGGSGMARFALNWQVTVLARDTPIAGQSCWRLDVRRATGEVRTFGNPSGPPLANTRDGAGKTRRRHPVERAGPADYFSRLLQLITSAA